MAWCCRLREWPHEAQREEILRTMSQGGADAAVVSAARAKMEAARVREHASRKPHVTVDDSAQNPLQAINTVWVCCV